jgi:hypothetical protein
MRCGATCFNENGEMLAVATHLLKFFLGESGVNGAGRKAEPTKAE